MKKGKFTFGAALLLCVVFGFISLCSHVFAQPTASANAVITDKLADSITLLNERKPQEARELIATIATNNPEYPQAQCYKALCLYELKDFQGFLKQMESPAVKGAAISPEVREALAAKQIDALFTYRRFEQVAPQIELFQKNYPKSSQLPAISEYQMAMLFERGMKKAIETDKLTDQSQINERWAEVRTNLQKFLSSTRTSSSTNYNYLTNRVFKEDVWLTRMILGDDKAAFAAIPAQDTTAQERFSFLRIQLFAEKLYRSSHTDQNLKLMNDYLAKFPESNNRKRVELDAAEFNFRKGEQLSVEADTAEKSGDTKKADGIRASASQYFQQMRSLQSQISTNKDAGIEESDVIDSRDDLLYSYFLEKDYGKVLSLSSSMVSESKPGNMNWMVGKLYNGIALASLPVPRTTEAASVLDEVLALGFINKPDHDHSVVLAAKWRIRIAQNSHNIEKAVQLVLWVRDSNCNKNIKADFLKTYGRIAGLPQN